jgi:predicted nicotinamide N-methyase
LSPGNFIRANTAIAAPPLVPELRLHLATEVTPLWQATEAELERTQLPPPYWAFAWPGGQALARWILDHPADFVGKHVLDFGAGSGLVAIAAAKVGASATAAEIDGFALVAIRLNADLNGVAVDVAARDVIGELPQWDAVLAGDMCYERPLAERLTAWLRELAVSGATVLLGDPGRNYFPKAGLEQLASHTIPTSRDLEDRDARETGVWRLTSS